VKNRHFGKQKQTISITVVSKLAYRFSKCEATLEKKRE